MKILIITHYFHPHIGGIEIVAYNQAKELVKQGHEVTIVSSRINDEANKEIIKGINIIRVKAWNWLEERYNIPYPIFSIKLISILRAEIKKADVVHAHGALYMGSLVASQISEKYKKTFIISEHVGFVPYKNILTNVIQKFAFATIGKMVLKKSKVVLVLSKNVFDFLSKIAKVNIKYFSNGIDENIFKPSTIEQKKILRRKYNLPVERKIILFVGRFVEKKGIDLILDSMSQSYDYVFVGKGKFPMRQFKKNMHIFYSLNQNTLSEIYRMCDVFLLPSKGEGFPLSIQEAMASGLAIVTTKDNIPLRHSEPIAVYINQKQNEILPAIRKLLSNASLYKDLISNARRLSLDQFSWKMQTEKILNIYKFYE
jgi:D-inositol-3-phosphate glycosyltransferase